MEQSETAYYGLKQAETKVELRKMEWNGNRIEWSEVEWNGARCGDLGWK